MKRLLLALLLLIAPALHAQTSPVVMLSDLHLDPLRDPAKAQRLADAPESQWAAILRQPASATQPADFAAVQQKCGSRLGLDPDFALMTSALQAAAAQTPSAKFVTVTGDLLVHQFECRWKAASGRNKGFEDFSEKTASFVIHQVEAAFPGIPVYVALGNNDTSCGDYRMDLHDRFFKATSSAVLSGLVGLTRPERTRAESDYLTGGYFNATIPGFKKTRVIALDDIFLSRKYKSCDGKDSQAEATAILTWLDHQLAQAKTNGEAVWFLAHIPPGIDVYSTVTKARNVCAGEAPELFLQDDALAKLLARYPETVRLALFGHTHSDEIRALGEVPAKLVGSVTPVNGNLPTVTIGQIDRRTARLADYTVYLAADKIGAAPWTREYSYRETFHTPDFSAASLRAEVAAFRRDQQAATPASKAYIQDFFPGSPSPLGLVWPQATCALGDFTTQSYRTCVCKQ